jgi:hypothetical protein
MFVLGAAYGIIEEGLMVKSFFDPGWTDLGILGVYGRWLEVNWVWSEWLTIYHAIFSIAIPITLVELAYPNRRNESWLNNRKLAGTIVLLCAVTLFGYGFLTSHRPPIPQYLSSAMLVLVLLLIAWKIPHRLGKNGSINPWKPSRLASIGFFITLLFFLLFGAGPHIVNQPTILMLLGMGLVFAIFHFLRRYDWSKRTLYHKFALAAGALGFFIAITPLQELDKNRPDNPQGMLFVGIVALVMLFILRKRLKSHIASLEARYCSDCNQQIPIDARFCPNCGEKT